MRLQFERQRHRPIPAVARLFTLLLAGLLAGGAAAAQDPAHPLRPPDRSSPRAALQTFLEAGDAIGGYILTNYMAAPSRAGFHRLLTLGDSILGGLDLSAIPPATREVNGRAAALALYDVLSRIPLPPLDAIPDSATAGAVSGTNAYRWVIPDTEIALQRITSGPRSGEYLFSTDTVARAVDFEQRVQGLPYRRPVPLPSLRRLTATGGGWLVPYQWIQAMPEWLRAPMAGQAVWKWIALGLILTILAVLLRQVHRLSRQRRANHPFLYALAQAAFPAFLLLATPAMAYIVFVQLNFRGGVAEAIEYAVTAIVFLAGAWISWRVAAVVAEAIIASPNIADESLDAHLIRICTRLFGIAVAASLLGLGAERIGLPVYGIIAGLGVGGLAIALAAQPTIENLIGGLNLFADRPLRVGDQCRCEGIEGVVEAIGIRSTRIRSPDRSLTTIPNGALSKMAIINLTRRDRILIKAVLGVRYETTPEQLRFLLVRIREMLVSHARLQPDTARARFIGFGPSSLDIEVVAYVLTADDREFFGVREDVWLRIMDIVAASGTGFAFPSQTLYFARDGGIDAGRVATAEAEVRRWRDEGRLPFPGFSPEQLARMKNTIPYPPPGSTLQTPPGPSNRRSGEDD